jgi:hypothetical protein
MIRPGDILPILYYGNVEAECRVIEIHESEMRFRGEIVGGAMDGKQIEVSVEADDDSGEEWKCPE